MTEPTLAEAQREAALARARAEHLEARLAELNRYRLHWPVVVKCDTDGCDAAMAWTPAPEEAQIVKALLESGWSCEGSLHRCPKCRRRP